MGRVRLTNLQQPRKVLSMSSQAWCRSVELAEEYGWQPLGAFWPDGQLASGETLPGRSPENALDESLDKALRHPLDEYPFPPFPREGAHWDSRPPAGHWHRVDQTHTSMMVILEDALDMADALDQALLEYEPEPVYKLEGTFLAQILCLEAHSRPGLGAITALAEFCRLGAFTLESA